MGVEHCSCGFRTGVRGDKLIGKHKCLNKNFMKCVTITCISNRFTNCCVFGVRVKVFVLTFFNALPVEGLGDSSSGLSTSLRSSEVESRCRDCFRLVEERIGDFTDDDDVLFFFWRPCFLRLSLAFRFLDSKSFSVRASCESLSDSASKSSSSIGDSTSEGVGRGLRVLFLVLFDEGCSCSTMLEELFIDFSLIPELSEAERRIPK